MQGPFERVFTDVQFEAGTPEEKEAATARLIKSQLGTCLQIQEIIELSLACWFAYQLNDAPDSYLDKRCGKAQMRLQLAHIKQYRRLPQNPNLPVENRRLGAAIDRGLEQSTGLAIKALDLLDLRTRLRIQREQRERHEAKRRARIETHRREQAERERTVAMVAARPVRQPKREKREPEPRCAKCDKRPRTVGELCTQCATWAARR